MPLVNPESKKLTTLEEYKGLPPFAQGYLVYMEGSWPGSEISGEVNPYVADSPDWKEWERGQMRAVLTAQDSEE